MIFTEYANSENINGRGKAPQTTIMSEKQTKGEEKWHQLKK